MAKKKVDTTWVRYGVYFYDANQNLYKQWVMAPPDSNSIQRICKAIVESSPLFQSFKIVYPHPL